MPLNNKPVYFNVENLSTSFEVIKTLKVGFKIYTVKVELTRANPIRPLLAEPFTNNLEMIQ